MSELSYFTDVRFRSRLIKRGGAFTAYFQSTPPVGAVVRRAGRQFVVAGVAPYTRVRDGGASVLIEWETVCNVCGAAFRFKTGLVGACLKVICRECYGHEGAARRQARREREVNRHPDVSVVIAALDKAADRPLSMARNASRKTLYAPSILRGLEVGLGSHSLEEIREVLETLLDERAIVHDVVGRRLCGHALYGFRVVKRPAKPISPAPRRSLWPSVP